jgi:hypothetical protein
VDVGPQARKAARRHGFQASPEAFAPSGGRSVDVEVRSHHGQRYQKGLISRNFSEPSDGLEPSTPSLPWRIRAAGETQEQRLLRRFSCNYGLCRQTHPSLDEP